MAVDVVAEQGGGERGYAAGFAVREQAAFDKSLESVADAQDKPSALDESIDGGAYLVVANYAGNEFAAAVGLVAG